MALINARSATEAAMDLKIKRNAPGSYLVGMGGLDPERDNVVTVKYFPHLKGWVAAANWDRYLYSDAVRTYRDAKRSAEYQLKTAAEEHAARTARYV
jgi:hypothetical protein